MQVDGVIGKYAIGGAVGAALYRIEVDTTDDVDVYILLGPSRFGARFGYGFDAVGLGAG